MRGRLVEGLQIVLLVLLLLLLVDYVCGGECAESFGSFAPLFQFLLPLTASAAFEMWHIFSVAITLSLSFQFATLV